MIRLGSIFLFLFGLCYAAEALLPKWLYLGVFIACGVIALWVVATTEANPGDPISQHPHPSDHWTGVCYRCGDFVKPSDVVRLGSHGKPDKHFHRWCFPLLLCLLAFHLSPLTSHAAMRFDGSDDVLHWDGAAPAIGQGLNFTNEISVAFWLNKEVGLGTAAEYIGKGRLKNGQVLHWTIGNNSGKFRFNYANPNNTFHAYDSTATFPATNTWMHVAFTWQTPNSNSATFYVNGVRAAGAWAANPSHVVMLTNNEPMRIGTLYAGSTMKGSMAECAVWNAYLGDDEIQRLALSPTLATPETVRRPALRGYWPLEREFPYWTTAAGTNTIQDLSGYGHHLTPFNSPQMRPGHLAAP